jgi:hypothetical protein
MAQSKRVFRRAGIFSETAENFNGIMPGLAGPKSGSDGLDV